jgi:hypothetical protein
MESCDVICVLGIIFLVVVSILLVKFDNSVNKLIDDKEEIVNICDMNKFNHRCPFCHSQIPKITIERTVTKHKRHRVRTKIIKEVIGEDWETHVKTCQALKEFLNKTKDE